MGLHQVVQYVQAYDYQNGLAYVTQLISQSNFSEISSFMPGVKMLLQTAMHMQIYLQWVNVCKGCILCQTSSKS